MIPYGRQTISNADVEAVNAVLRSDYLTTGNVLPQFEACVVAYTGAEHAVAVNSATSALHLACRALDVGKGDLVWTSPNTFVASANCALYCGAEVDFVDIDPQTYSMSVERLREKLASAALSGRLPKVVIPVHFSGEPCDMAAIGELARVYGFKVIEDASHAVGARYRDTIVGDCAHSDISVFSFHPVKIITTAEGGMSTTRSTELAEKMRLLRSHGILRDDQRLLDVGSWYYEQQDLGFNYRMTEIQAALGISQLTMVDDWVLKRHELAESYDRDLADLPLQRPVRSRENRSALHLYVIKLSEPGRRRAVFEALRAAGIGVNVHYIPVHTQPYYEALGFRAGQFPESERYYAGAITLPLFPALTEEQRAYIVATLKRLLE